MPEEIKHECPFCEKQVTFLPTHLVDCEEAPRSVDESYLLESNYVPVEFIEE